MGTDSDERERIDYIFYLPTEKLKLKEVKIIGPKGSIIRNKRVPETSDDPIEMPDGVWPTDHKAVLGVFRINR